MVSAISLALGGVLVALVYWDLFQTIVLPRPSPGWFRIGRYMVRPTWRAVRAVGRRRGGQSGDNLMGSFAPASTVVLLFVWLATLMLGYGLVFFAMRDQLRPVPADLGTTTYFAATSILTLGFGDFVAAGTEARAVAILASASGLGAVALVVTYVFSLYASYQRREVQVVRLQAAAGAPPSAVALLENYRRLDLVDRLPALFEEWERWAAEVLDTHVAYPLLGYFRSSHDNLTWIGALGSVLDAACLVLTTLEDVPRGQAELFRLVGAHLVEDISNLGYRAAGVRRPGPGPGTTGAENTDPDAETFAAAWDRLAEAGYKLTPRNQAWLAFQAVRTTYAARLDGMASYWAVRSTSLLGTDEEPRSRVHS
jgi:hypothetical protein